MQEKEKVAIRPVFPPAWKLLTASAKTVIIAAYAREFERYGKQHNVEVYADLSKLPFSVGEAIEIGKAFLHREIPVLLGNDMVLTISFQPSFDIMDKKAPLEILNRLIEAACTKTSYTLAVSKMEGNLPKKTVEVSVSIPAAIIVNVSEMGRALKFAELSKILGELKQSNIPVYLFCKEGDTDICEVLRHYPGKLVTLNLKGGVYMTEDGQIIPPHRAIYIDYDKEKEKMESGLLYKAEFTQPSPSR